MFPISGQCQDEMTHQPTVDEELRTDQLNTPNHKTAGVTVMTESNTVYETEEHVGCNTGLSVAAHNNKPATTWTLRWWS